MLKYNLNGFDKILLYSYYINDQLPIVFNQL